MEITSKEEENQVTEIRPMENKKAKHGRRQNKEQKKSEHEVKKVGDSIQSFNGTNANIQMKKVEQDAAKMKEEIALKRRKSDLQTFETLHETLFWTSSGATEEEHNAFGAMFRRQVLIEKEKEMKATPKVKDNGRESKSTDAGSRGKDDGICEKDSTIIAPVKKRAKSVVCIGSYE